MSTHMQSLYVAVGSLCSLCIITLAGQVSIALSFLVLVLLLLLIQCYVYYY